MKHNPHPVYAKPKPIQAWEWALVYPAYWFILLVGPLVERVPWGYRKSFPKNTYRGL